MEARMSQSPSETLVQKLDVIRKGGGEKYHAKNAEAGKMFARDRINAFIDPGSFVEDGALANVRSGGDLPADGVITGVGKVDGRDVAIMANDSTVKAGSWGARTVEKIVRIQELPGRYRIPIVYLVDSAGARITDQIDVPRSSSRRTNLLQRGQSLGVCPATLFALWTLGGRRCVYPRVL